MSFLHQHARQIVTLILLGISLPLASFGQQGTYWGIQSNNGFSRLASVSQSSSAITRVDPGFGTSASIFLQWNFVEHFGARIQADALLQILNQSIRDDRSFSSTTSTLFGQGSINLQGSATVPLNSRKSLFLEIYGGIGIRREALPNDQCTVRLLGLRQLNDTVETATVHAFRWSNNGIQPELLTGIRVNQQLSKDSRFPVFLTFGAGFRRTLTPIFTMEGNISYEEVPINGNALAVNQRTWEDIISNCQQSFMGGVEPSYTTSHFGELLDIQIGLKVGL